jgi:hypothetical protein
LDSQIELRQGCLVKSRWHKAYGIDHFVETDTVAQEPERYLWVGDFTQSRQNPLRLGHTTPGVLVAMFGATNGAT